nr:MAG TPA: hypothetical protein [Caudoviricetes sp.]
MKAKHLTNPVTLTLELDDLGWLHNFLKEESLHAEIDHEEVERLHTDVAIQAAKTVLSSEHAQMTSTPVVSLARRSTRSATCMSRSSTSCRKQLSASTSVRATTSTSEHTPR